MSAEVVSSRAAGEGLRPSMSRIAALALTLSLGACDWFTDFKDQPSIRTYEPVINDSLPPLSNPEFSVPVTGVGVPAYIVSYQPFPATIDSLSGLANPVPVTEASLLRGRILYQINCSVCHGPAGAGNGPVVPYGYPPISLVNERVRNQLTDGYIYGMIRNGRGSMPSYNRIEELDRWDVVNYVRALQGVVTIPVDTTPLGIPGETGRALRGVTATAPTRPAPYLLPDTLLRDIPPAARVPWLPPPARQGPTPPAGQTTTPPATQPTTTPPGGGQ